MILRNNYYRDMKKASSSLQTHLNVTLKVDTYR